MEMEAEGTRFHKWIGKMYVQVDAKIEYMGRWKEINGEIHTTTGRNTNNIGIEGCLITTKQIEGFQWYLMCKQVEDGMTNGNGPQHVRWMILRNIMYDIVRRKSMWAALKTIGGLLQKNNN